MSTNSNKPPPNGAKPKRRPPGTDKPNPDPINILPPSTSTLNSNIPPSELKSSRLNSGNGPVIKNSPVSNSSNSSSSKVIPSGSTRLPAKDFNKFNKSPAPIKTATVVANTSSKNGNNDEGLESATNSFGNNFQDFLVKLTDSTKEELTKLNQEELLKSKLNLNKSLMNLILASTKICTTTTSNSTNNTALELIEKLNLIEKEELKKEIKLILKEEEELNLKKEEENFQIKKELENQIKSLELKLKLNFESSLQNQLNKYWESLTEKWSSIESSVSVEVQNQLVDFTNSEEGKLQFKRIAFTVLQDDYSLIVPGTEGYNDQSLNTAFWQGQEDIRKDLAKQQQQSSSNSSTSRLTLPNSNSSSNIKSSSSTTPQPSASTSSAILTEAQKQTKEAKDANLVNQYGLPISTINVLWRDLASNEKFSKLGDYTKSNIKAHKSQLDKLEVKILNLENNAGVGGIEGDSSRKRARIEGGESLDDNKVVAISSTGGIGIGTDQINKFNSTLTTFKNRLENIEGGSKSVSSRLDNLADSVSNAGSNIEGMMERLKLIEDNFSTKDLNRLTNAITKLESTTSESTTINLINSQIISLGLDTTLQNLTHIQTNTNREIKSLQNDLNDLNDTFEIKFLNFEKHSGDLLEGLMVPLVENEVGRFLGSTGFLEGGLSEVVRGLVNPRVNKISQSISALEDKYKVIEKISDQHQIRIEATLGQIENMKSLLENDDDE